MMLERLDMFSASLPRKCLYCRWGYPVVFGTDDWLNIFACGAHTVDAFRTKRIGLRLAEKSCGGNGMGYMVAPLVDAWCSCEKFKPIAYRPSRPGEFVNARKLELLDRSGIFDDMKGER